MGSLAGEKSAGQWQALSPQWYVNGTGSLSSSGKGAFLKKNYGPKTYIEYLNKQPGEVVQNNQINPFPRGRGCDINPPAPQPAPAAAKSHDEIEAGKLGVSVGKYLAMKAYAQQLVTEARRRREKVKESTIRKKVAKKFNIKLS